MTPTVRSVLHDVSSTFSYVVWDPASRHGVIIDPALDFDPASGRRGTDTAEQLLRIVEAESLTIDGILETHAHADHISAAPFLQARLGSPPVAIGEGIRTVQERFKRLFNLGDEFVPDGRQFDRLLRDGEVFHAGDMAVEVMSTPGHTSDHVTYRIGDALFVGDTLFMPDAGTARCDFPGGDAAELYRSTRRLFEAAPPATRVFLLHDYGPNGRPRHNETTIAAQRRDNIHVHDGVSEADYVAMREARDATLAMPTLILPAVQVNIRAGAFPPPEDNGLVYLKIPVDAFP